MLQRMTDPAALSPKQFVEALEEVARDRGVAFGRLEGLRIAEADHRLTLEAYRGYTALAAAAQCFTLETVEQVNTHVRPSVQTPLSEFYPQLIERLAHYFRTLRAADLSAQRGYAMHGYTQLRNLFDNAVLTAAAAKGLTNFYKLDGIDTGIPFDPTSFRKNRRNEERNIRALMTGDLSGLSDTTRSELKRWDVLFDDETHGGVLSRTQALDWLKGVAPLPLVPVFHRDTVAMFMNRYCEIAWMVHRLLPLVQPKHVPLPDGWKAKWTTLDGCFRQAVAALTSELGRPIGNSILELVQVKFPFDANSTFWD